MGKAKTFAIGAAILGAAGYVAGMLTAPKSGKETREEIRKITGKGLTEAEKDLKKLHTELNGLLDEAKNGKGDLGARAHKDFELLLEKAKDTKEKAREVLSALHEGDAEDKDLHKAIKDANAAIDHLKDYLKK